MAPQLAGTDFEKRMNAPVLRHDVRVSAVSGFGKRTCHSLACWRLLEAQKHNGRTLVSGALRETP